MHYYYVERRKLENRNSENAMKSLAGVFVNHLLFAKFRQ